MSSAFVSSAAGPSHLRRTVAAVLSLMVLGTLLAGCRNSRADSDKSGGARTNKSGIDAEAQEQAEKYWGALLTKCDGTIYGKDNRQAVDQIYEFRDSSIRIKSRVLSDADRMNGIEWSGDAYFDSKTSRVLTAKQWERGVTDRSCSTRKKWRRSTASGNSAFLRMLAHRCAPLTAQNCRE